ncbi:hypothetical protein HK099_006947 [Clydaea vesicula]|uniref:Uncharacterized protein n=1 Tax=Clydaea vesicula TaxID=447962 RepID=A0AAD5XXW5_9FUNG|nr:hypothetical protein HK099_006947 [Clydaea vesicula]
MSLNKTLNDSIPQNTSIIKEITCGGCANAVSTTILNVFDVTKVRLQIQHARGGELMYESISQAIKKIYVEEGFKGLTLPGLPASIIRELTYSGLRFGLYTPLKNAISNLISTETKETPFIVKFFSGMLTGIIGSSLANPTDLVKIRMQAEAGLLKNGVFVTGLNKGLIPSYNNTLHCFYKIWKEEGGSRALYKGVSATALRAGCVSGGQLASYDHTKSTMKKYGIFKEGVGLHVFASVVAGLVATTLAAPADLIKTRLLGQRCDSSIKYNGIFDCAVKTVTLEGPFGLFRGWLPSYFRIAPHFIITLPLFEFFRKLMGLNAL